MDFVFGVRDGDGIRWMDDWGLGCCFLSVHGRTGGKGIAVVAGLARAEVRCKLRTGSIHRLTQDGTQLDYSSHSLFFFVLVVSRSDVGCR